MKKRQRHNNMYQFIIGILTTYSVLSTMAFFESEKDLKKFKRITLAKKNHPSSTITQMNRKVS